MTIFANENLKLIMKKINAMLAMLFVGMTQQAYAEDDKVKIPDDQNWEITNDRSLNAPQLYQDDAYVYVYTTKQLDNLTIGITDMQGNVHYEEVTTVPACMYYAISIESLPAGTYYLCVYQGSNYVIGMFNK